MIVNFPVSLPVSPKNFQYIVFQLQNDLHKAYFLHFASSMELMIIIAQMVENHPDLLTAFPG